MTDRARRALACLAATLVATGAAAQSMPSRPHPGGPDPAWGLRAPNAVATEYAALPAAKAQDAPAGHRAPRVGSVREAGKASRSVAWQAVAGGWVARLAVGSAGARGLRARIALPDGIVGAEVVARGTAGAAEGLAIGGAVAWTPWTPGERQEIEVFATARPAGVPAVEAIVHLDAAPGEKGTAGTCSPDVACPSGDAARDAAIAERRNSVAMIQFVEGTEARVCTATLLNTEKYPTAFLVTANHCIATAAAAASVTTIWFNEADTCGGTVPAAKPKQVAGGATLVFTSHGADSTLLQLARSPPSGVTYAGWNAARLAEGDEVVSVSHPQGDAKKFALGTVKPELLVHGYAQEMYGVAFSRGVTEGGSSGSGLFTLEGGSLQLRGVLSGSTLRTGAALSCANAETEEALYGRFEIFHPQVAAYIAATPPARTDDYGNRLAEAQRLFPVAQAIPSEYSLPARIDYAGDVDVFRIDVPAAGATLTVRTEGELDTVGTLMDAAGHALKSVNDAESERPAFGLTRTLTAGTYYVAVSHREAQGTGAYAMKASLSTVVENYTDLWWNPAESGWGLNINHQGQTLFVTLFVYDRDGQPLWLVAPSVTRDTSGGWQGTLLRMAGPAFNAQPWPGATHSAAGSFRIVFSGLTKATISYTLDGTAVTKPIQRQAFSVAPVCGWSAFDRSFTTNFQDLWSNPEESGWGMNLAHQGDILFATLFTYTEAGRPVWLVMNRGERVADGLYIGELLSLTGSPYPAAAWTGVASTTPVGTLTVQFTRGNAATITYVYNGVLVVKRISRQLFGVPATECHAPGDV